MSNNIPNCLVIPSANGKISDCIRVQLPKTSTLIFALILSWLLIMLIAYLIFYFLNRNRSGQRYSYWIILLVLVAAMLLSSLVGNLFLKL